MKEIITMPYEEEIDSQWQKLYGAVKNASEDPSKLFYVIYDFRELIHTIFSEAKVKTYGADDIHTFFREIVKKRQKLYLDPCHYHCLYSLLECVATIEIADDFIMQKIVKAFQFLDALLSEACNCTKDKREEYEKGKYPKYNTMWQNFLHSLSLECDNDCYNLIMVRKKQIILETTESFDLKRFEKHKNDSALKGKKPTDRKKIFHKVDNKSDEYLFQTPFLPICNVQREIIVKPKAKKILIDGGGTSTYYRAAIIANNLFGITTLKIDKIPPIEKKLAFIEVTMAGVKPIDHGFDEDTVKDLNQKATEILKRKEEETSKLSLPSFLSRHLAS